MGSSSADWSSKADGTRKRKLCKRARPLDPRRHPPYPPGQEGPMDANVKKTTLRMIPYGLYVLTAAHKDGSISAGTVNFVTQAPLKPPLRRVGIQTGSPGHALIKDTKAFTLKVPRKGH